MGEVQCPICDVEAAQFKPVEAFALGVAVGRGASEMHAVTASCCSDHRTAYTLAMFRVAMAIDAAKPEAT